MVETIALVVLLALPCWWVAVRQPRLVPVLLFAWVCLSGFLMARLGFSGPGKLAKDVLFVLPLYAAVFGVRPELLRNANVPTALVACLGVFTLLTVAQIANPRATSPVVGILGLKVWLLYIPLFVAVQGAIRSEADLRLFLRGALLVSLIVFGVALLQYQLSLAIGFRAAIALTHGEAAYGATQGFVQFSTGGGFFGRLPATFAFAGEFYNFCGVGLTVAYAAMRFDPSRAWRLLAIACLVLGSIAYVLSGSRGALAYLPMFFALVVLLDRRAIGGLSLFVLTALAVVAAAGGVGVDLGELGDTTGQLARIYSGAGLTGIWEALQRNPLGIGTGSGTLAARHLTDQLGLIFEGTYGKAAVELGIPGPILMLAIMIALLGAGFRAVSACRDPRLHGVGAALLAYFCIQVGWLIKGLMLDLDPTNVIFWIFAGLMLRLPLLHGAAATVAPVPTMEKHPFLASLRTEPTIRRPPPR